MDDWDNFFVAQAGAAVAFAGLVLVSVSINLERIVKNQSLVGRSAEPLIVLFTLFVTSSLMLIPDQALWVYGVEILLSGTIFSIIVAVTLRKQRALLHASNNGNPAPRGSFEVRVGLCLITALSLIAAGVLISLEHDRGVYWLVPAMVAGFLLAFLDAWVLLIEIDR